MPKTGRAYYDPWLAIIRISRPKNEWFNFPLCRSDEGR